MLWIGEWKWRIQILIAHPILFLFLQKGEMEMMKKHIQEDLERVRSGRKSCFHNAYLYQLVRNAKPEIVVETGVKSGSSSAFILQGLRDNNKGVLYSIDLPGVHYNSENTGFVVPQTLRDRWTLVMGDARTELPKLLSKLRTIGIFHHDSLHTYHHMMFEFETAWPKIENGGYLASDDAFSNEALADFCDSRNLRFQRQGRLEAIVRKPPAR